MWANIIIWSIHYAAPLEPVSGFELSLLSTIKLSQSIGPRDHCHRGQFGLRIIYGCPPRCVVVVQVREATSNDPWGPSSSLMSEIADLTYNVVAFSEIMSMVWKRLNDHGKNWRHVYKVCVCVLKCCGNILFHVCKIPYPVFIHLCANIDMELRRLVICLFFFLNVCRLFC